MKETTSTEKFYTDYTLGMMHGAAIVAASLAFAVALAKLLW